MKWRLEVVNWYDILIAERYNRDRFANTYIYNFSTLQDVWNYLGFKLKKQSFGYSGIKNGKEFVLTRRM